MGQKISYNPLIDKRPDRVERAFHTENKKEAFTDSKDVIDVIVHSPMDLAFLSKPDGTIVAINPSGADMFHQKSGTLIGTLIFELLPSYEARGEKAVFEKVIKTREPASTEGQLAGKLLHQNINPVFDLQGNVRRLAVFSYDITDQKKTEQLLREKKRKLKIQAQQLDDVNTTLEILLKKREQDKKQMEHDLVANVKNLIEPCMIKIKNTKLDDRQKSLLNIIESNIQEIVSPLTRKLSMENCTLTPTEIRIANFIKHGHTSKEISNILNISIRTVETHRKNIREKIGICRIKANLQSYLLSMESSLSS